MEYFFPFINSSNICEKISIIRDVIIERLIGCFLTDSFLVVAFVLLYIKLW